MTDLGERLFVRAEEVSRQKMTWTRDGLRLPTRLRVLGDRLSLDGREGHVRPSLRLDTFASVMLQLGVLATGPGSRPGLELGPGPGDGLVWAAGSHGDWTDPRSGGWTR